VAFKAKCDDVASLIQSLPCEQLTKEKLPQDLETYTASLTSVSDALKKAGPEAAKNLIVACTQASVDKKTDVSTLAFCIGLNSLNLPELAKGNGTVRQYGAMMAAGNQEPAPMPAPDARNDNGEPLRKVLRQAVIAECIEAGAAYVSAACGAIAVHELFAKDPYSDSGDLAKAGDEFLKAFGSAAKVEADAKSALTSIGVPVAILTPPNPIQVLQNPVAAAQQQLGNAASVVTAPAQAIGNALGIKF
jgi:hypothetical protein